MAEDAAAEHGEKPTHVPAPILEKLNKLESDGPRSWDEVSRALEDLKPTITKPPPPTLDPRPPVQDSPAPVKSFSFHTLEELDAKLTAKPAELRKTDSMRPELKKNDRVNAELRLIHDRVKGESRPESGSFKPVRENIFIVKDRLERQKEGNAAAPARWDPLSDFPQNCPPGGSDAVVLYTTSLGGVRRTYEDCNRVRAILENHRVVFDERDVALHGGFLAELKGLVGEGVAVPRLFVKGRYVGGAAEVVGLNETGRLGRLMSWARVERGAGRQDCGGCGGARFVPCLDCGGSCKIVVGDKKERCDKCNENGLVHCPNCL